MRLPRIPDAPAVPPGIALLPLRLFLGGTFVYAGIEKLTDPGFLAEGAPTYIGSQLEAFADGTPGGLILRTFAEPIPEFAGVGVALAEIVIGLLAFFGLLTRAAARASGSACCSSSPRAGRRARTSSAQTSSSPSPGCPSCSTGLRASPRSTT
jgi:uncharacterized membrane protein YphA (DoxX/SURF4 family)